MQDPSREPKLRVGDTFETKKLQIHSKNLLDILRAIIEFSAENYIGKGHAADSGLFYYPYADLHFHHQELIDYKSSTTALRMKHSSEFNSECDEHIDVLSEYLSTQSVSKYLKNIEAKSKYQRPTIPWIGVWVLFKPGIDVYVRENDGSLNAYVIDRLDSGGPSGHFGGDATSYKIIAWNLSFDGQNIWRRAKIINIAIYDNEEEIMRLPVFPARCFDDTDDGFLRKALIERGKKYFQYCKTPSYLDFTGTGLGRDARKYKQSRVVVDHSRRPWIDERLNPQRFIATGQIDDSMHTFKYDDYDKIDPKNTKVLSEHQYFLMSSHMFGYNLNDRHWDLLDVDGLEEPVIAKGAIDYLVMKESKKDVIKAIATVYTDTSDTTNRFRADFVRNKGEGQIILLHGPPGTGKTLTAEAIAEYTRRPLLSITGADLGDDPSDMEQVLLETFRKANDWDAIILLDEADIYLQQRSTDSLERNSVVTVFLRALEYFQGIFFLTTNRVGQFDEAIMSRIHVSIGYDELDDNARNKIWDNLFHKLEDSYGGSQRVYEYGAYGYATESEDVKKLQWNGREIRNAFQTAVALAVFEAKEAKKTEGSDTDPIFPKLTKSHLKEVVGMSSAFRKYMTATHMGVGESDRAYKAGNRNDNISG
ncbi:P-loop containing nucleoside triphosphate hydrolase protein [Viridothelium virens]|uniref:P-loop containing nucleoside triphosphate hydrolase protein n=1 Tax=Viridothelium virens TaxID=1048519 RepID=A0A6A6HPC8_VIRVR|nr:P-loop containing nucleoside triphosphate hydrolase protein [Viridothelium virens]